MRLIYSIFFIIISLTSFSQEETFQKEFNKLDEKLESSEKKVQRITTCREILE